MAEKTISVPADSVVVLLHPYRCDYDGGPTNSERADWVAPLVDGFLENHYGPGGEETETVVRDIVTNLCHLLHQDMDLDEVLQQVRWAVGMFEEEVADEVDDDGE